MENEPTRTYGALIEQAAHNIGLSQAELGRLAGVSPTTIGNAIKERLPHRDTRYTPSAETLLRIATVLDMDPAQLLTAARFPQPVIDDLINTPLGGQLDLSDLDPADQRTIKRIADIIREEKYSK